MFSAKTVRLPFTTIPRHGTIPNAAKGLPIRNALNT
jgi:hypothetical protein